MLLPVRDNIRSAKPPIVNTAIIASCVVVFVWEIWASQTGQTHVVDSYALTPRELFSLRAYLSRGIWPAVPLVTSMFLHGGFLHVGGNMLFLWVFGDNVEDRMGHLKYLAFYLLCGVIASLAHALLHFRSDIPSLGASGAIAGVMGAYVVLFPRATIRGLLFVFLINLPAWLFIGYWFVLQLFSGVGSIGMPVGVAFFAHIGGFVAGVYLVRLFARTPGPGPRIRRFQVVD